MAIRLNLGVCDLPLPKEDGWVNIDNSTSPHIKADLIADVTDLSRQFDPGTVDEIWGAHLLEHLTPEQGHAAMDHWKSLLKPGGILAMVTPDFKAVAEAYLAGDITLQYLNDYYIYSYVQESHHQCMYDQVSMMQLFAEHGFTDIHPVDRLNDPRLFYKDSLQMGVEGRK